ncbi:ABC transporter ATP-binding protein [Amycolatopsis alkalitolerans]|uniref:ABC transporter ATP-binding protein n=1 Tax=Amycolatopsis alkalitolerans TaxID=2547244 RepID=A0A5C4LS81_9PSEU|nr:ABC transporter ATP-binding protein [Amycolatopsis alkalitolerans]TNC20231.1 ABC transporter ATP-binding protein [Amycolatopsis alkalitolerans]
MSDVVISATGVSRTFIARRHTVHALGPVDFAVDRGQFVAIVGPSGCGKSTLLRIVAGLAAPSAGELVIDRADPKAPLCSMVFQDYGIFPWKTVLANVRLPLDIAGVSRARANEAARAWIERAGVTGFESAYPATLSGGMRQRVALARAFVANPEILLMDEPFAALDAQLRLVLQQELLRVWEANRRTILFVTHSIDEALLLADRVVVMSARPGRILEDIEVPFARPRTWDARSTAEFGALEDQIWRLLKGEVEEREHAHDVA